MKMVMCILQSQDKDPVTKALNEAGYRVTSLASTGAYFRRGNTTLLVGVEDDQVDRTIGVIRENCSEPPEPGVKRATVFVLDIDRFEQV